MDDRDAPNDRPATPHLLERLLVDGVLSREAYRRARRLVWPEGQLFRWLDRSLLVAGLALLVSGLGYLLVHQWTSLPRLVKFGIVEAGLAAALATAYLRGFDSSAGTVSLGTAMVAVGGCLVLVGVTYPTGADAWQLFALWSAATVGFAFVGRSQALWLFWVAIVDAAVGLYWFETIPSPSHMSFTLGTAAVGLVALVALAGGELVRAIRRPSWLETPWSRWVLMIGGFGFLSLPVWTYVGTGHHPETWFPFGVTLLWVANLGLAYAYYRWRLFDLVAITVVALAALSAPVIRVVTFIVEHGRLDLALLIAGLVVLVGSSVLVWWLGQLGDSQS